MTGLPGGGPGNRDVLLDVSELVHMPLRTGIQRVTRELIRFWPGPGRLLLCAYDEAADRLRFLPGAVRDVLIADASGARLTIGEERNVLHAAVAAAGPDPVPPGAGPVLNVELFINPGRAALYERLVRGGRKDIFWLLYDFIPWLQPHWFPQFAWRGGMGFLHAARDIPNLAFISEATRDDFRRRIARNPGAGGPVIPLGGDGLGLERQHLHPGRDRYVTLGTLEPRKRFPLVLEAFRDLWAANGTGARLTVVGRLLPSSTREAELIAVLDGDERFTFLPDASDEAVRDELRRARALLFPSGSEGFGLPPFEALGCGIPVVATPGIPALDMLPPGGRVMLPEASAHAMADAVLGLERPGALSALWEEAARVPVPTWRDFAAAVAAWVGDSAAGR